jgi:NAD(P)-dependent dehydrogenase (short-subunit alcohol dehydrogenase family)
MRVVITGANRGIGLELAHQYLERGERVEATSRDLERAGELERLRQDFREQLGVHALDVGDDAGVKSFAEALGEGAIDVLVNNAGVLGKMQSLTELDLLDARHTFEVNALGALRVTRALLPHLRRGGVRKIVSLTSAQASIADNDTGGAYGYRMSKVALNMASRSMAHDLRAYGIISVVLNPGWVQTDMGGPRAPVAVEESVRGLISVIERIGLRDSGRFMDYTGAELPW